MSYLVGNPEDRFSRDVAQIDVAILMGMIVGIVYSYEPPHDKTNKVACAPSEYSDQPGHPPSLISVFAVRMKKAWILSYPLSAQRRLWSDWADAQADLSLRLVHIHCVSFVMRQLLHHLRAFANNVDPEKKTTDVWFLMKTYTVFIKYIQFWNLGKHYKAWNYQRHVKWQFH